MSIPGVATLTHIDGDNARRGERVALRTALGYGVGMVGERMFRDAPALEGLISGIWLATEKIGFAAGGMLVGLTLGAFGFSESIRGLAVVQTHVARIGIAFSYVGLGTMFYLLTLGLVIWMKRSARTLAGIEAP